MQMFWIDVKSRRRPNRIRQHLGTRTVGGSAFHLVAARPSCSAASQLGFTLIELITVIIMLGILSVFAAPRIFSGDSFNARGFHDETLAFIRYAQKAAIAQRRTVCVTFTLSSVTLTVASRAATANCDIALRGPNGESPGNITARDGAGYKILPADFNFDGLGQPVNAAGTLEPTQTIQVNNAAKTIAIETVTGYVHE